MTQTVELKLGDTQSKLDFVNNRIYVGRDPGTCGLTTMDGSLSRRHAEVYLENGMVFIRDLGSSNGTWVNGQLVGAHPVALQPGQSVYLGMVPLVATWQAQGGVGGGSTVAMAMPAELKALVEQRRSQMAAFAQGGPPPGAPAAGGHGGAPQNYGGGQPPYGTPPQGMQPGMAPPQGTAPQQVMAPPQGGLQAPSGLGVGGHSAPLPAEYAYRRQGGNNNGTLLIALRGDTFANDSVVDGFLEFTATDNETVASITIDLVEHHKKGPGGGHVWDRMLVRQGPWKAKDGDVLPLPFQLRVPPGTSISSRDVHWELRGYVDINWASDIEATSPITMRNSDIERIRDALGALDYRIAEIESLPLGQRFEGSFMPPHHLAKQMGINEIGIAVEYLGANIKVIMAIDKKGLFKRDKENATVFELMRFRAAPLQELTHNFKQQIDTMMATR